MLQKISFPGFPANHLVAYAGKSHLLTSSNLPVDIRITNAKISNVERVKLLGVNFEGRLNFDYHVNTLLKRQIRSTTLLREYAIKWKKKNDVF